MERSMGSRKQHKVKTMKKEFRVWCHRTKSWLHNEVTSTHVWSDYSIDIFNGKLYEYVTNDGEHFYKHKDDSEFTIHLWTGLYDKNGKKIFEGDIVEYQLLSERERKILDLISIVEFVNGSFGFFMTGFNDHFRQLNQLDVKVIGNIMENKNILTE